MSHTQSGWVSPQSTQPKHDEQDTEPTLDSQSGLLTTRLCILGESTKQNARVSEPKSTHSVLSALKETGPDTIASQCSVTGSAYWGYNMLLPEKEPEFNQSLDMTTSFQEVWKIKTLQ